MSTFGDTHTLDAGRNLTLTLPSACPTIPGMDRRRFLLTSPAGALVPPTAEAQQASNPSDTV
jgi:hypothetical protein